MDVSLIINRLGGANALARKLSEMSGEEIKPDAVYKWRQRRKIAWRWHRKIETLAAREGVELRLDGEVA